MGPAPAKLRGRNPGDEALVSAFIESIGRKSSISLRTRTKGITSRLAGRWPFLPLLLEFKSKSFATLNLLWGPTYFKGSECRGGGHQFTILVQKTVFLCGIFLVVGNTKSVTIDVCIQRRRKPQPSIMRRPIGFSTRSMCFWPKANQQEAPTPSFISRRHRASRRLITFTTWKTKHSMCWTENSPSSAAKRRRSWDRVDTYFFPAGYPTDFDAAVKRTLAFSYT